MITASAGVAEHQYNFLQLLISIHEWNVLESLLFNTLFTAELTGAPHIHCSHENVMMYICIFEFHEIRWNGLTHSFLSFVDVLCVFHVKFRLLEDVVTDIFISLIENCYINIERVQDASLLQEQTNGFFHVFISSWHHKSSSGN